MKYTEIVKQITGQHVAIVGMGYAKAAGKSLLVAADQLFDGVAA